MNVSKAKYCDGSEVKIYLFSQLKFSPISIVISRQDGKTITNMLDCRSAL